MSIEGVLAALIFVLMEAVERAAKDNFQNL
jgi:hypothetical protein